MAIRLFTTGGTIDDLEYDGEQDAPEYQKSLIPKLVKDANLTIDVVIEAVCFKDSKFINDQDRQLLLKKISSCAEKQILITHGTMTMVETATFLAEAKVDKAILLFGAMIPANKPNTDAHFNLGFALSSIQHLSVDVYIAMHGCIFNWKNIKKNHDLDRFEVLNNK